MERMTIEEFNKLKQKNNKHRNVSTEYNGRRYDSLLEARHAKLLDALMFCTNKKEKVVLWAPQVPYSIRINGELICKYIADFVVTYEDGRVEVQDVKSAHTRKLPVYRIKKKLMRAVCKIDIIEIT